MKLTGLGNLKNLKQLDLAYNQISELKGLQNLKNIKIIGLTGNLIPEDFLKKFRRSRFYVDYCESGIIK